MTQIKQKIIPNLWFDDQAEEASVFYTSLFRNSGTGKKTRYRKEGYEFHRKPEGSVMTVEFELEGYQFVALNGGPEFKFTPAISFFVTCETASEVDELWRKFSEGGQELMPLDKYEWSEKYGWIQDRYGLSWQLAVSNPDDTGQKITPSLLFVGKHLGKAEEAINTYTSVFNNSHIDGILYYGPGEEQPEGLVKHAQFSLDGEKFMAMESGLDHDYGFTEAISLSISCNDQQEIDHFWNKLSEGGDPAAQACGWLKDRFGISWQVVPAVLPELLNVSDPEKARRVNNAFLEMKKIEIDKLKHIYEHA